MPTATKSKPVTVTKARRVASASAAERKPSASTIRAAAMQRRIGYAFGGLAFSLTALSLSHLAEGVSRVAHRPAWEGWSVAVAIDCGFIAAELLPFMASAACVTDTKWSRIGLSAAVLCASAAFNSAAFMGDAVGPMRLAAIALGVAVPCAIATFVSLAGRCLVGKAH